MDRSLPRLVLAALAVLVLGVVLVTGATSTSAFGTHNPSWDGTSEFRGLAADGATTDVLQNASTYDRRPANGTIAVVLSPGEPYGSDAAHLRRFVERGGTVLVAEDFRPHANALLADVGASARFDGRPLRDERNYVESPELAEASVVGGETLPSEAASLTGDAETLVLNRGTVLDPAGETVLAETSRDAYLDADRDGTLDDDESPAVRPVASVESVGDGRVVALSDPSVLINAMLERGDNRAFARSIVADHDRVVFDVSRADGLPPLVAGVAALRTSATMQFAIGALLVVTVAAWPRLLAFPGELRSRRSRRADRSSLDPDAVARSVSRDHPAWEDTHVHRVAERVLATDDEGAGDGDVMAGDGDVATSDGATANDDGTD